MDKGLLNKSKHVATQWCSTRILWLDEHFAHVYLMDEGCILIFLWILFLENKTWANTFYVFE